MNVIAALLADAATVAEGKLYVHGGGWDRIFAATFPTVHPMMAVAVHIEVAYTEAQRDHQLEVALLDADGNRLGPYAGGTFNVGHPPGGVHGAPAFLPVAMPFAGVSFHAPGQYEWVVTIDGEPLARLPLSIAQAPFAMAMTPPSIPPNG